MTVAAAEWVHADQWRKRLAETEERYRTPQEEYPTIMRMLEANEHDVFVRLHGRFVNTGATRRSLTSDADESIRRIAGADLEFGTGVWYAHFLTRTIGPPTGKGGMKRTGGSAVLRISRARQKLIAHRLLLFLVNGGREDLAALTQEAE